jgi:catechol 2,3-dioxygenase-like lactoylglutathione lyase family enzyme
MTLNHIFLMVSPSQLPSLSKFYTTLLSPLSYTVYHTSSTLTRFGSNYPYFWLKALPSTTKPVPTHIAFDAPDHQSVDRFYQVAMEAGARDNGPPGIREEMGRQPYYAAFVLDVEGNNIEAVCVEKEGAHLGGTL